MAPINPNIGTKEDYASRPSVPSNKKNNATEFNLLVSAVKSNYERLILDWTTDIIANAVLAVGQYVLYDDGSARSLYRIDDSYNVGNPITWDGSKASVLIEGVGGDNHFKGVYADETALTTAHPAAEPGDYALVDVGSSEAELWIWDETDTEWVASGVTTVVPDANGTTKGIAKLYPNVSGSNTDGAPDQASVKAALDLKAPLNSPAFTGDPTVPNQTAGNNSTRAANTAYVDNAVSTNIGNLLYLYNNFI